MTEIELKLTVNGAQKAISIAARTMLADALREHLQLTGTHVGCEHGVCGACTVFVDRAPIRSCITLAAACQEAHVVTVEGLDSPLAKRVKDAFKIHHALQCGFCTPGMLISAIDLIERLPQASEAEIREEMSGNLCRCTGYAGIVKAIQLAGRSA